MIGKIRNIASICLALCLLFMSSGAVLRITNEARNKSVIPVAEYNEFLKASYRANTGFDGVLPELKKNGVSVLAVKETTLADLLYSGNISAAPLGEFLALSQRNSPGLAQRIRDRLGEKNINPSAWLAVTGDEGTAVFVRERLERRFGYDQLAVFKMDGQTYFCIKAEIDEKLVVGLGFEEEMLRSIRERGFEILLRPRNSPGSNYEYLKEYEKLVKDFNVKYLIFDGSAVPGAPERLDVMKDIINNNGVILGLIESATQIGYIDQKGIDMVMKDTRYAVSRAYIPPDAYLERLDGNELFYQWIRGVIDRNIRMVYITPLKNKKATNLENINAAIGASGSFTSFIAGKGYMVGKPLQKLSSRVPSALHYILVALSLVLAGILYLLYLLDFKIKPAYVLALAGLGILAGIAAGAALGERSAKLLALSAAVLYPAFSSLMVMRYLRDNTLKPLVSRILMSLALLAGINALGMYTIITSLSDVRYTMMVEMFRGVVVSFIVPIMLFGVNFIFCFVGYGRIKDYLIRLAGTKVTYFAAAICLVGALAFFIYVARSGNGMGVSASSLELKIREIFERTLAARPRFKEFFIGYPALFAMVYLYGRYKKDIIPFLLGIGVVVGGVSMVNSFCHVFTPVNISVLRTIYGLVLGTIAGAALVAALHFVLKFCRGFFGGRVKA